MSGFKYITMAADTEQDEPTLAPNTLSGLSTSGCLKHMLLDKAFRDTIEGWNSNARLSAAFDGLVAGEVAKVTTEDSQRLSKVCKAPAQGAAGYPSLFIVNEQGKTIGTASPNAETLLPHLNAAFEASDKEPVPATEPAPKPKK